LVASAAGYVAVALTYFDLNIRFAKTVLKTPYQQHKLMRLAAFQSYLADAESDVDLARFWAMTLLRPACIHGPIPQELRTRPVEVEPPTHDHSHFVDVRAPRPITKISAELRLIQSLEHQAWYHPFQIWQAYLVRRYLTGLRIADAGVFFSATSFKETATTQRKNAIESVSRLARSWDVVDSLRLVTFLAQVAPLVMPSISGRLTTNSGAGESYEGFIRWRMRHDQLRIAEELSLTKSDIERWHEKLATFAYGLDPLRDWLDLTRLVSWAKWNSVKGKPALAHRLYTMARIIRDYAKMFLSIDLPEEDELWHGGYVKQIKLRDYGVPRLDFGGRDATRRVAREFGVAGDIRLIWFVEGDTEIGFIKRFAHVAGVSLNDRGMELVNLRGDGELKSPQVRQRLALARGEDQFTYVLVDASTASKKALRHLAEGGLVTAGFTVWDSGDFERANFSDAELGSLATQRAAKSGVTVSLTGQDIAKWRNQGHATGSAVNRALREQHFELAKGEEWGCILADWAAEHVPPPDYSVDGERPVVAIFARLVRACAADFLGSISHFRVDPDTGTLVTLIDA
jgi:hypothetical protein